jgi:hypothetical protein
MEEYEDEEEEEYEGVEGEYEEEKRFHDASVNLVEVHGRGGRGGEGGYAGVHHQDAEALPRYSHMHGQGQGQPNSANTTTLTVLVIDANGWPISLVHPSFVIFHFSPS